MAADPQLEALQRQAGSGLGQKLALPQIAAVAELARKLRIPVSRPALAASADHDIDLWVRATPEGDEIALELDGWTERPPGGARLASLLGGTSEADSGASKNEWAADEELRIISLSTELAEHLGVTESDVERALAREHRLNAAIDSLSRPRGRTLQPFTPVVTADLDALVPLNAWLDPERPIAPDELVNEFIPQGRRRSLTTRFFLLGGVVLAVAVMAAIWQFTPIGHHLNLVELAKLIRRIEALPLAPLIVLSGYVAAAIVAVPITVLIAATGLVFGAWPGIGYALCGTMLSAIATYGLGGALGRDAVRRLAGTRANRPSERIGERGIVTVMVLRLLPIAPFTIVNLVAGASHIRLRDFTIGSALGMTPGILLTVTFAHQLINAIRHPDLGSIVAMAAIGSALVSISVLLQRWLGRRK